MQDKTAELGRPLTEAEEEAIIKRHGHPILVGGQYLPQHSLIGPALFPIYWFTLTNALSMAYVLLVVVSFATLIAGSAAGAVGEERPALSSSIADNTWFVLSMFLALAAVITIVFATLEHFQINVLEHWSVRKLARLEKQGWNEGKRDRGSSRRSEE